MMHTDPATYLHGEDLVDMGPRPKVRPWRNAETGTTKYRAVVVESWPGGVVTIHTCPHAHHSAETAGTCAEGGVAMARRHGDVPGWS